MKHPQISMSDPFLLNLSMEATLLLVLSVEMHSTISDRTFLFSLGYSRSFPNIIAEQPDGAGWAVTFVYVT
jgi:hypothetical protein